MEGIHGVDVSWLHHSNKDNLNRAHAPAAPGTARDPSPPASHNAATPDKQPAKKPEPEKEHTVDAEHHEDDPSENATTPSKGIPSRPRLLHRGSSEKSTIGTSPDQKRRGSWISSISAKFSSSPGNTVGTNGQGAKSQTNATPGNLPIANPYSPGMGTPLPSVKEQHQHGESLEPYVPQPPEQSRVSFLSNALRRLSSNQQSAPQGKAPANGGMCPRRVMNVDPNRERCLVPELDSSKLRRVAFCVDVEIAGGPRYKDDDDFDEKKKRTKDKKLKEKGEGEALKHPEAVAQEKDKDGMVQVSHEVVGNEQAPNPEGTVLDDKKDGCSLNKKKEKKKRSEAERKERKEKKRRKAEESGSVPMEYTPDGSTVDGVPVKPQDRPTTDPLRIYRRCCQLRETPILKRISEQLAESSNHSVTSPGVVNCLNLTGSRLTLADMNTLGDWLAVVPVKKLLMEDAELTDEGVRVILAGLLAARSPDQKKRQPIAPKIDGSEPEQFQDRSGVVEKLSLKHNLKISREGWKHIALFIYMCRSLKAIDLSAIPFPQPRVQPKAHPSDTKKQIKVPTDDIAEILCKSLSERLGGSYLEELLMTGCSLTAANIRKIVDGVIVSGIQRLGLSSNAIDDEGLDHVVRYLRSGVCHGVDLGGNDLRDRIEHLCEGINEKSPLWALSLADCNLTPTAIKPLFPHLVSLQNFRFIDLSHNRELFSTEPSSLATLRKYIPQLRFLKRIHLEDVSLTPQQAIGLAEVLPECPQLAHINLLENPELSALASASDESSQEEACAVYASLMAAVRISESIICIDMDVPSQDTSEIIKALAKQVVAYCLRNMERATVRETTLADGSKAVEIPEVLLHIVGHDDESEGSDEETAATDDDYIVGGTGLVKALNYCLLEKVSDNLRRKSSLPGSGTATPRSSSRMGNRNSESRSAKAKTMSKDLLNSARKIKARLQPALAREARAGDDMAYRRLLFLENTLQGIIQRFEAEYPECRISPSPSTGPDAAALAASLESLSQSSASRPNSLAESGPPNDRASITTAPTDTRDSAFFDSDDEDIDLPPLGLRSRHNSDVSLASRAQTLEEGRIHRLGQSVRREILRPQIEDHLHGTTGTEPPEPQHLAALREQLFTMSGDELRHRVLRQGWEETVRQIGANAEELRVLERERPEEFSRWKESQIAAQVNAGMLRPGAMGVGVGALADAKRKSSSSDEVAVED
ncbi:uncharacterized protein K452DRAFT_309741 [Aplosporella prunicola CBS 121167]|uniref:Uncharacterized protein n=1 Tax=Aplosporella prunicola CBS 121167 TaxID=1176127 RepID=A0A6A6BBK2_9PEZI|nr:uncharacterized protein K452DRAFT_309741 [Aplosporella prunicola CBS 121167]KAF2140615.1 hypothetical protein K452DRAFT_309741 [Aplosporella prunicola CBS 121167]